MQEDELHEDADEQDAFFNWANKACASTCKEQGSVLIADRLHSPSETELLHAAQIGDTKHNLQMELRKRGLVEQSINGASLVGSTCTQCNAALAPGCNFCGQCWHSDEHVEDQAALGNSVGMGRLASSTHSYSITSRHRRAKGTEPGDLSARSRSAHDCEQVCQSRRGKSGKQPGKQRDGPAEHMELDNMQHKRNRSAGDAVEDDRIYPDDSRDRRTPEQWQAWADECE